MANVRNAGGVILAKTNTPEFGAGANTTNRVYGPTGNPVRSLQDLRGLLGRLGRGAGARTGAARHRLGLRRQPAHAGRRSAASSGFRPSPGVVPSRGSRRRASAPSASPGRWAARSRTRICCCARRWARTSAIRSPPATAQRIPAELGGADLGKLRVAVSPDLGCAPVDRRIADVFQRARRNASATAFKEVQERAPDFSGVHEVFEVLRGVHFVAAHRERLEKSRDLLDRNVIDNTERGLALFARRRRPRARRADQALQARFLAFFKDVDVLICPAASVSPFPHSQLFVEEINGEKMPTYMRWLAITYAPTMALACAAAIPCGVDHAGMPFGIQVIGPNGADARVLEVAHALEQVLARNKETARPIPPASPRYLRGEAPQAVRGRGESRRQPDDAMPPLPSRLTLSPLKSGERELVPPHPTRHTHPRSSPAPARCRPASRRSRR